MSDEQETTTSFSESPASWNTRYINPKGFVCQLTLRAETGRELLEKATGALSYLLDSGCIPLNYNNGNKHITQQEEQNPTLNSNGDHNPSWCPIHEVEMKRWEKGGKAWFSHKTQNGWCSGKDKNNGKG